MGRVRGVVYTGRSWLPSPPFVYNLNSFETPSPLDQVRGFINIRRLVQSRDPAKGNPDEDDLDNRPNNAENEIQMILR